MSILDLAQEPGAVVYEDVWQIVYQVGVGLSLTRDGQRFNVPPGMTLAFQKPERVVMLYRAVTA